MLVGLALCLANVQTNLVFIFFLKKTLWPLFMDGFNCLKATATSRRQFTSYHTIYIIAISFIIPLENDISFICIQNSFNAEFVQ